MPADRHLIRFVFAVLTALSMTAALAMPAQGVAPAPLPFTLPIVLAAFAGSGLILSFLPDRTGGLVRLFGTILFCTLSSAAAAAPLTGWLTLQQRLFAGAELLVAFALAAAAQILIPWAIENRDRLAAFLAGFIPGRKP